MISTDGSSWFTRLHGEQASIAAIRRAWIFSHGGFFTNREVESAENVAVLGSIVSEKLFGAADPIGKQVMIRGQSFRVRGVVASGTWMVPAMPGDGDFDAVYIPVTTAQRISARQNLDTVTVSTASTGEVTRVAKELTVLLRERHGLGSTRPDDFVVASEEHKSLAKGGMRTDIARAVVGNVNNLDKVTLAELGKTLDLAIRTMTARLG